MEKVIGLKSDRVFRHAVRYDDGVRQPPSQPLERRAARVRDIILESVMLGRLDRTDLRIIAARDCSPMPSSRKIASQVKVDHSTVLRRMHRIKSLVTKAIPA